MAKLKWLGKIRFGLLGELFLLFSLTTVAVFAILQWLNLEQSRQIAEQDNINSARLVHMKTNQFLDIYMDNIKNILFFISSQQEVLDESPQAINKFLLNIYENNSAILSNVYLVKNDGNVFCSNQTIYEYLQDSEILELFEQTKKEQLPISWSEPYYSPMSGDTIAFTMSLTDKNHQFLGAVILESSSSYLSYKILSFLPDANQTVVITSANGNVILYDPNSKVIPLEYTVYPNTIKTDYLESIRQTDNGVTPAHYDDKSLILIKSNENSLGWHTMLILNQKHIKERLSAMYQSYLNATWIWIITLLFVCFILSYYFTRPIRKLAFTMSRLNSIDNIPTIQNNRKDEIGGLIDAYNLMTNRINKLAMEIRISERTQKAFELKMLQSQINPHFLYNTLSGVRSLIKQQRYIEAQKMIRSFVELLSFSFDRTSEFVKVHEELEGVRMYVDIQKMRYGDIFDFEMCIMSGVTEPEILKLTLQPIIENAIFHGVVPAKKRSKIRLTYKISKGILKFVITDNGLGMTKQQSESLLKPRNQSEPPHKFNSVGLYNVNQRITLRYGDNYGIKIRSRKNKGTVVVVRLPFFNNAEGK